MAWYIARRFLYLIPTVLGVLILTFILFNVAGGDLASVAMPKSSAKQKEDFDFQRGLDKPVILGRWGKTRAFEGVNFSKGPGAWDKVQAAVFIPATNRERAWLRLPPRGEYPVPLVFPLAAGGRFQLVMTCRTRERAPTTELSWRVASGNVQRVSVPVSEGWRRVALEFEAGADPRILDLKLVTGDSALEIRRMALRKRVRGVFDSQLAFFFRQLVRGELGESVILKQPVTRLLKDGVMPSLYLMVPVFFAEVFLGIVVSLTCAFFRNTFVDRFFVVVSVALMCVPYLVWIIAGQYVLGYALGWFPIWGFQSWAYLLLPVLIGVLTGLGAEIRLYRTIMLDEVYKDYVRTAFAKGVSKPGVLFKHVLKNAMIPIITNVVIAIPFLYSGSLLLETFFGIPGLGYLSITALNSADVDVVRAVVLIGSILYVFANLVTDICYALVDPRVRLR